MTNAETLIAMCRHLFAPENFPEKHVSNAHVGPPLNDPSDGELDVVRLSFDLDAGQLDYEASPAREAYRLLRDGLV
ncbi:MAG: hypothetical protein OXP09_21530 [Gammaproteobacteria bacterium]|nr:hypothetical protein [Rhodospirillaceae bacterium]MDE0368138.1 hypothetical protein [Gammaproteobacteria bacterium]